MIISGKYYMDNEIGKGSFATVYKGHVIHKDGDGDNEDDDGHNLQVAIKAVPRSKLKNKKLLENLEIEIAILKKIKHPHIVSLIDCERTSSDFYLVMEYCALGDLTFLIKRRQDLIENHPLLKTVFEKFPPPSTSHNGLHRAFVLNYLQQLASSLKFLRSKNLVHRDIKPQNLLLATPLVNYHDSKTFKELGFVGISSLPILKIADFGFARFLPNTSLAETLCGSPLYMAPEILNYQKYNAKADLWSVGTVLYEMCCGRPPFKASNHLELYKKIKRANDIISFPQDCIVEPELQNLIFTLLTFDPVQRIGFQEFFDNKLVNEDLSEYEVDNSVSSELELKSRYVVQSNMFISEYISPKKGEVNNIENIDINSDLFPLIEENKNNNKNNNLNKNEYIQYNDKLLNLESDRHQNGNSTLIPKSKLHKKSSYDLSKVKDTQDNNNNNNSGSDLILEKEYVVVEKKSVEVNSFADEIAQVGNGNYYKTQHTSRSPILAANILQNNETLQQHKQKSPRTSLSSNGSNSSRRASLVDRRLSISSLNPSNALSRALGVASTKLFGGVSLNSQPYNANNNSNTSLLSSQAYHDLTENILLRVEQLQENDQNLMDITSIVGAIESLSAKAFVVYLYAEIKFSQILPLKSSTLSYNARTSLDRRLSEKDCAIEEIDDSTVNNNNYDVYHNSNKGRSFSSTSQTSTSSDELPPSELYELSTEAIILYMKSLSILAKAMQLTSNWWYESQEKNCPLRLNLLVQWMRDKFNECLEKADFLRLKLSELKNTLSSDRTINTIMVNTEYTDNPEGKNSGNTIIDDIEPICLEKLLYDRALEISRTAAKLEIQGGHFYNCELAYATSLWMLETLLDDGVNDNQSNDYISRHTNILDDQDTQTIKKYIDSIANRLKSLRKKISNDSN